MQVRYVGLLEEHLELSEKFNQLSEAFANHLAETNEEQALTIVRMQTNTLVIDVLKKIAVDAIGEEEVIRRIAAAQEEIERGSK